MRVKIFLGLIACLCAGMPFGPARAEEPKKWNVLFLIADDLNTDLGCYNPAIKTPNIDRLAAQGVLFEHAYCQFPHCNPSRSSLLTGRRPDATKVFGNGEHFRTALPDTVTLPQLFRENGYYTARVGKIYHRGFRDIRDGTAGKDDPPSWDLAVDPAPKKPGKEELAKVGGATPGRLHSTLISWLETDGSDDHLADTLVADEAIKILGQQTKEKPFFLAVGMFRPHTPYVAPKEYFAQYPLDKITIPSVPEGHQEKLPRAALLNLKEYPEGKQTKDPQYFEHGIQAYHAATSFMDSQVGRVLEALEKSGLADSTIVVFMSDHGYHLGEHGFWHKRSLFERGVRVPLIIDAPDAKGNGHASNAVVESLDIYPTLAGLCGLKPPPYLEGASLVPVLNDPNATVKECAVTEVVDSGRTGYSVRTPRYRYTEWGGGKSGALLYDMEKDPQEFNDLSGDPAYAEVIKEHKALLARTLAKSE